ncbi:MAG: hypothetical protein V4719_32025 [Planctomycetota bacterium]
MRRYQLSWAMFIGAALCLGQPVWADDEKPAAGPNPEQIFKELDKNSDGQLSADEISEDRKRFFERLVRVGDKNSDGKLSAEEFQKASKADDRPVDAPRGGEGRAGAGAARFNAEEMFKRLDRNGDGKFTRDEIPGRAEQLLTPLFDRLGKDELTKEDLANARERLGGQGRAMGNGLPGGGTPEESFKRLDTNNDGKLTVDEAPERARPLVERVLQGLGKEKDGSVSKEEFLTAAARLQGRGRDMNANRRPEGAPRDGERRPEGAPRDGERRPEGERRGDGERRPMLPRFFNKLDTNHDGRISADELAKASELFKELDENGDGQLDPRELMGPPPGGREGGDRPAGRRPEAEKPADKPQE